MNISWDLKEENFLSTTSTFGKKIEKISNKFQISSSWIKNLLYAKCQRVVYVKHFTFFGLHLVQQK